MRKRLEETDFFVVILMVFAAIICACVFVAAICIPTHADPLPIRCTAPTQNNAGTCDAPILNSASGTDSLWVIFTVTPLGLASPVRRDSVWRRPGGMIEFTYNLPRGYYTVTATPGRKRADGSMRYGCPVTKTNSTQVTIPFHPTFVE